MTTPLQDQPLEIHYTDPPPEYKLFDDLPSLEAQPARPAAAIVTETRAFTTTATSTRTAHPVAASTATVSTVLGAPTTPAKPSDGATTIATLLWLVLAAYFFATAGRAALAVDKHKKDEFWCHSYNGGNLIAITTFAFFGLFVVLFSKLGDNGRGCVVWPIAVWAALLVGMGIRGNVCGNWGSV